MSQVFEDNDQVVPVTIVEIEPNIVIQIKSKEKDGYEAVQLGTSTKKKISGNLKMHFKNLGDFRFVKEAKMLKINGQELKVGDKIDASIFAPGEQVKVTGITKGKGFQGVMKRHGFHGMPHSHGHHHVARHAGSIGQRFPQHTLKGTRMAGRMGGVKVTTRGLKVVKVDVKNNLLAVKGAIPGNKSGLVIIQTQ